jgi:hypothetical protein
MFQLLAFTGLFGLGAGLLVFLFPSSLWKKIFHGPKLRHKTSVGASLLFSGLLVLGCIIAWVNVADIYTGWRSNDWPSAVAVVTSATIRQTSQPRSSGAAWTPEITYSYQVDGVVYESSGIRFGSMESTDREWVERQVNERFAVGKELVAFYDPENPSRAVIEKGYDPFLMAYVLLGLVFAAVGAFYVNELYHDWDGSKADERLASPL